MSGLKPIFEKSLHGQRLTLDEGLLLFREAPLLELGAVAHLKRMERLPDKRVTYVIDASLNFTNVCVSACAFCAFFRKKGHKEAFTLSVDEILDKVKALKKEQKVTTILLQGGLHPDLPFSFYTDLVKGLRKIKGIHPHLFSAPEVWHFSQMEKRGVESILSDLKKAGLDTLPGGGAEVLTETSRKRLSPNKVSARDWLTIHEIAHKLGFRSTATMMFGLGEEDREIVEHLESIRALQDRTRGFTAFVPWSFKPGHTALAAKIPEGPGGPDYLRVLALARVYLDNFDHVQASWFSEGKKTGEMALRFGGDDFGGTVFEESVMRAADWKSESTVEEIKGLIRQAGFEPAQRDTKYNLLASP